MKEIKIKQLAYYLKEAKKNNQPQPIFFLGAGASFSGNIPLAHKIAQDILSKYQDNPAIQELNEQEKTYSKLMECLSPNQRNSLLKKYIDEAKINVTHIYLAQLLKNDFADYVLTVNFDNLMLRALALYNIFPSTYDMAILTDLTTTTFPEKSVVYLHGQHHGLWLLNTDAEMSKVNKTVPKIFDSIKNQRPWIFIGYSGSDPIFEHVKNLGRFDNGLYWVGYNDDNPNKAVEDFLNTTNRNTHYVKGYDADAFMLKLNEELGLAQPQILTKPFSSLKDMLEEINDINDEDHFKGVKERLDIAKKNVSKAIEQFENVTIDATSADELKVDVLKQQIIKMLISEDYDEAKITAIETQTRKLHDESLNENIAGLYYDWAIDLGALAKEKQGTEKEELYTLAFEKYQKATEIKPDFHEAFNNWGNVLGALAQEKQGTEKEELYTLAFEKFQKATEIKLDLHEAFYNWGTGLGALAKEKQGTEKEKLYTLAFEKYQKATEIKPDKHEVFYNWGNALGNLAKEKQGTEKEELYTLAFEKYQKATEIKPDFHDAFFNWGAYLGTLAEEKQGIEKEELYTLAFEKFQKATEIKPDEHEAFNNWGNDLGYLAKEKQGTEKEELYTLAFEKYQKATEIKPDFHDAFYNWGNDLGALAEEKQGTEKEKLYTLAFEKYQKATEIKPDKHEAFYNWGIDLVALAKEKQGTEKEKLYTLAFEKYQKATEIKPDLHEAFNNWGNALGNLAEEKQGTEKEERYTLAFEKFQKATEIQPDDHEAFNNWGNALGNLAKEKQGIEKEELYKLAFEKYQKGIDLGGSAYNMACLHSILKQKKEALHFLEMSLAKNEIPVEFVSEDKDWKHYVKDKDFKAIIEKYSS